MNYQNIPNELTVLPNWVLWKKEFRNGRETKVPYSVNGGGRASSTNPDTWDSFTDAVRGCSDQYNGIGFMLTLDAGIIFIDIDHCIVNGEPDECASDILSALNTYCEISQSGTGLHLFVYGTIPRNFKNTQVEMYADKRYCAMTGNIYGSIRHLTRDQLALDYVFNKYKTPDREQNIPVIETVMSLSDRDIISKAQRKDRRFCDLWSGNWSAYPSHSEADLALCSKLAFWTDCDMNRIDTLFRGSGLFREKWNREEYRMRTITQACSYCRNTLSEWIRLKEGVRKRDRH